MNDGYNYYYTAEEEVPALVSREQLRAAELAATAAAWLLALGVLAWLLLWQLRRRRQRRQHLHHILYRIRLPKESDDDDLKGRELNRAQIAKTEALIEAIGGLKAEKGWRAWWSGRQQIFALEIVAQGGQIDFYIAAPVYARVYLEQQIYAQFPEAEVGVSSDYNIFASRNYIAAGALMTRRDSALPLKTYVKEDVDSLSAVLNVMSKLSDKEAMAMQLVLSSAPRSWHSRSAKLVRRAVKMNSLEGALKYNKVFAGLNFFLGSAEHKPELAAAPVKQLTEIERETLKGVEEKSMKAGLEVNLRLVSTSPSLERAERQLYDLAASFSQYNYFDYGNGFVSAPLRKRQDQLISDFIHRRFDERKSFLLNTEECASLFHLPIATTAMPGINWLAAKSAPAPVAMPQEGLVLGVNQYRGQSQPVRIKAADRLRHTYIVGKSGVGKSVLLANMAIQDVMNGEGLCVLDPHGDLIDDILARVPEARAEDVVLFAPADTARPMALNLLEYDGRYPEQKTFVINEMIGIFDKLYDLKATGGPIFEQYMRNAMLLIMNDAESGATLLDIPRVLSDSNFRREKLAACDDPMVVNFWVREAENAGGDAALANIVPYITSKLTTFISNDLMRPIIGQTKSSFNLRDIMDEKKILLVSLPKGIVGELNAYLLGMIIVGKILMAALSRADSPQAKRSPFYLYIDEFQNFTTDSITQVLSEARKYGLGLTLAHQYIGQLTKQGDTAIKDAVFGNVGTMAVFKVGPEDAEFLEKAFKPQFGASDLVNVDKYTAFMRLLIDNANAQPFTMKTPWPLFGRPDAALAEKIKQYSRLKYGTDRALVEAEIRLRLAGL